MPKLTVNGQEVEFENGMTVLQACELAGEEIPRFCYHERLAIAGNCRMCLVQIEGGPPKPAASCAMPAGDGMVVHTNSEMVKKAREGVMEFLLINHPLDCPICDQGGECDLQDQAMTYGCGDSRYSENKRSVKDKYMGPLIKTHMTRCIHCTRCVRFITDVAGVEELGAVGRGEDMEISTYVEKALTSEMSGNIIDLCPVGALTSRPYAFKARPWELRKTESVDVLDAVGSNIRVDARGREVMRVLPRLNEDVNEEWISDKTRFACDGLKYQRLDKPYIRKKGKLQPASWDEALEVVAKKLEGVEGNKLAAIAGDLADCESMFVLKEFITSLGSHNIDCRQDGAISEVRNPASYSFNTTIAGIERADFCLLVGANPKVEAPIVDGRIRKAQVRNGLQVELLGNPSELEAIIDGKHDVAKSLKKAKKPMVIVGADVLVREDANAILEALFRLCDTYNFIQDDWNGFNVLQQVASRVGGLAMEFTPFENGKSTPEILDAVESGDIEVVYLLGADELDMKRLDKAFVIYQGHHGDAGAHAADVILPGAAYTEKDALYVNMERRPQEAFKAVPPVGEAKEDWLVIAELSRYLNKPTFGSLDAIRSTLAEHYPLFGSIGEVLPAKWKNFGKKGKISKDPVVSRISNFYRTDSISRASQTMAKCTSEILESTNCEEAA